MGATDVIPGVSGGTTALLTGIYNELISSLQAIDREALGMLRDRDFSGFWTKINGNFLITIFLGIITSIFTAAKGMIYLSTRHPVAFSAFFFGLIAISVTLMLREIKKWNSGIVLALVVGTAIAYGLTILPSFHTPDALWAAFFAGMVAACGMLLPGISGGFILLIIGKYRYVIGAITTFNIPMMLVFSLGCVAGLLGFSRILGWVVDNYHGATVALLAGLMLGTLNKLWPWRQVMEFVTNNRGQQVPVWDKSILPWHYVAVTGKDPQVFQAILMMAIGVFIMVLVEKISARLKTKL